jgi:hypothetical protein
LIDNCAATAAANDPELSAVVIVTQLAKEPIQDPKVESSYHAAFDIKGKIAKRKNRQ